MSAAHMRRAPSAARRTRVHDTVDISIVVQVVTGVFGVWGLVGFPLDEQHRVLHAILLMETIVQAIELLFYVAFIRGMKVDDMARVRYYDWFITTPTMLVTTIVYMAYEAQQQDLANRVSPESPESPESPSVAFFDTLRANIRIVAVILASNFTMLLFGYLAEVGVLDWATAFVGGFAAFALAFYSIWERFARKSKIGTTLFQAMALVWACYGLAFLLPPSGKNVCFNFLDIIAKNFFGIFIFHKVATLSSASSHAPASENI